MIRLVAPVWARAVGAAGCLLLTGPPPAPAQSIPLSGYLQTVPIYTGSTGLQEPNASAFNRFRLSTEPVFGSIAVRASYEHAATFRRRELVGGVVGVVPTGGEWLDLQWGLTQQPHVLWGHRFDRLHVDWEPARWVQLSAGRQAISWGTTLFLTPADPFLPFSPADPFREFRGGVDGVRMRLSPSPLSEIDIVFRPSRTAVGEEVTVLGRGLVTVSNWELSGWGGTVYGDPTGALGLAGALGAWAIRGEASLRQVGDHRTFRGTIGVDRLLQLRGRDLLLLVEYQRDGFGGRTPDEYVAVARSEPFRRGELQVIGRDETVMQLSYQLHPLWAIAGLWLWNLNDRSALLSPTVAYSVSDEAALAAGLLVGVGRDIVTAERPVPSEYGLAGVTGYLSLSWFF